MTGERRAERSSVAAARWGAARWPWRSWEVVLILATVAAFLPSLGAGFVLDDQYLIVENPYVRGAEHAGRALTTHLWDVPSVEQTPELLRYYRPLVTLSYILDFELSGGRPLAFHLTNVLLHLLAVGLAFVIGRRWLQSRAAAGLAALLFALHPTRTENVIWVSGRPDLLAAVLLFLWLELAHWARAERRRVWALPLSLVALSLALLSKETMVAAPLLLGLEALAAAPSERRAIWRCAALPGGLVLVYLASRSIWLPIGGPALEFTPAHGLVTVLHFAERVLLPWPQTFYFDLPVGADGQPVISTLEVALGAGIVLAYGWLCLHLARQRPLAAAFLIAAVAFLGPLLNLTKTGSSFTTSDRFLYLPVWLCALGALEAVRDRWSSLLGKPWLRLVAGGVLLLYVSVNAIRCLDFYSPAVFWDAEVSVNPENPVALLNRASIRADAGDTRGALEDLDVALSPRARAYITLATPENQIGAYLMQLRIQAELLPDGAAEELDAIALELLRILAAEPEGPRRTVRGLDLGRALDASTTRWLARRGVQKVALAAVPILSRLDRRETTVQVLDLIPDRELPRAPRPLSVVLAEGREGRFEQARRRLAFLEASPWATSAASSPEELGSLHQRLSEAEAAFSRAQFGDDPGLLSADARIAAAEGFAHLGAYFRALALLAPLPVEAALPLRIQLLVAARLEHAALVLAQRSLGEQKAEEVIASLRASLPPSLRELRASPLTD